MFSAFSSYSMLSPSE